MSGLPGFDGDLELGADAVIGRDQDRIVEPRGLEVEQAAEAADLAIRRQAARWRRTSGLMCSTMRVAGVDVDARLRKSEDAFGRGLSVTALVSLEKPDWPVRRRPQRRSAIFSPVAALLGAATVFRSSRQ